MRRPNHNFLRSLLVKAALPALALPILGGCNLRQYAGFDMYNQPKAKVYRKSDFFEDRLGARPIVSGTVARSEVYVDRSSVGVQYVIHAGDGFPADVQKKLDGPDLKATLERGQVVYNVYCSVCHGQTGLGDGMIVQRGFTRPPSFVIPSEAAKDKMQKEDPHRWARTEFIQTAPPSHFYNAITQGFGAMYSYGERVKPADRWAVAAYIKTLQATPAEGVKLEPQPTPNDRPAAK
ncbi:c-type cytochrome [Humisphaera borealis]|uniref:Cytochrome c n=1 Tax=Humisphaera borealis TaxID=2807512 RepID=A0A7M2X1C5_9BACT|nr:cytochrome c [Humisphaera borealis]QOV91547.1 cytochrome c [Humisphaera borealis]